METLMDEGLGPFTQCGKCLLTVKTARGFGYDRLSPHPHRGHLQSAEAFLHSEKTFHDSVKACTVLSPGLAVPV